MYGFTKRVCLLLVVIGVCTPTAKSQAISPAIAHFHESVEPILARYCFDCHGDGMKKGGVSFDEFGADNELLATHDLWSAVLKNLRAGLMPPEKKPRPSAEEMKVLEKWIKFEAFGIDPNRPDPGRVTLRRLNRAEYRNTIRDLMGVDFDAQAEFPTDDTGYGFDNIGDVLTLSPMLLEKYMDAAKAIVSEAVPMTSRVVAEKMIPGRAFRREGVRSNEGGPIWLSYYKPASISNTYYAEHSGEYQLVLNLKANENYVEGQFDYNKCQLIFKVDGKELLRQEYTREEGHVFKYELNTNWSSGEHELAFELQPLTPDEKQIRSLTIQIDSVVVRGPMDKKYWVPPRNYSRFFPREVPEYPSVRSAYAGELLSKFATRAFRRPVDDATTVRLAKLAEEFYNQPGKTFEAGVAHAMVAVLASPRFLFREEEVESNGGNELYPFVDEYSLASRLSYFLWSTMPDEELFQLAGKNQLRKNMAAQVSRMLADRRSEALMQNFAGQWLQVRDIDTVPIDARAVLRREEKPDPEADRLRARFKELVSKPEEALTANEKEELGEVRTKFFASFRRPRADLTGELRWAMRREAEMYFGKIAREDRNVTELIQSDYTFLNEKLAQHYGLTNLAVTRSELRQVILPKGSPRGGVLTMGGVLAVTSNPTRTSPVKRGLFILENILGNPTPPPPPDIPPLEDSEKKFSDHEPSLRETLEAHRHQPLCSSCHNRMDPLGLALENFNAMGMWRDEEHDQSIDVAGKLITGESFTNVIELKHILATNRRTDFYRTLTEKLLTYALGRGLEYYDVETVDQIVTHLEQNNGRFSALLMGIVESAPFQKRRDSVADGGNKPGKDPGLRAETKSIP